jgi:hypothetical protein
MLRCQVAFLLAVGVITTLQMVQNAIQCGVAKKVGRVYAIHVVPSACVHGWLRKPNALCGQ